MTLPRRSDDRVPRRSSWVARLRRSRGAAPRTGPAGRADHGSWTVDRVVRALATVCDRENRGVPAANAVVVGPDTVWLHLRTPDERPPTGWTSDHDGRTWHAQLRMLQSASVAESLEEPYPQLVSLGRTSKGFVLLNLGQAGGIIALEGDARQARVLTQDWTRELTTSPWSRGVQVVRIGFKSDTADPVGTTEAKTLVDAEAALADEAGGILLLAGLPGGRDRERVFRLADDPEGRWSVVVLGRVEHPRWRFTIDSTGGVDTGLLDEPVAHSLNAPLHAPVDKETDAGPAGHPVGAGAQGSRRQLSTRWWIIGAAVAVVCLSGTAVLLAPWGTSTSSAPVKQVADTPVARREAPASSPAPKQTPTPTRTPTSAPRREPAGGSGGGGSAPKPSAPKNPNAAREQHADERQLTLESGQNLYLLTGREPMSDGSPFLTAPWDSQAWSNTYYSLFHYPDGSVGIEVLRRPGSVIEEQSRPNTQPVHDIQLANGAQDLKNGNLSSAQRWNLVPVGHGYFQIVNRQTGNCLTDGTTLPVNPSAAGFTAGRPCESGANDQQRWKFTPAG